MKMRQIIFRAGCEMQDIAAASLLMQIGENIPGMQRAIVNAMERMDGAIHILSIDRGYVDCVRVPKAAYTMNVVTLGDQVGPIVEAMVQAAKMDAIMHMIAPVISELGGGGRFNPKQVNINVLAQALGMNYQVHNAGMTQMRQIGTQTTKTTRTTRVIAG